MIFKKTKWNSVLILYIVLNFNPIFGQEEKVIYHEFITNWNLLGPLPLGNIDNELSHNPGFENDFLLHYGGEGNPKVKVGKTVKVGSNKLKWIEYTSPNSIISLDNAISKKSNVAAYAYKEISLEKEGTYIFALGTNDGGRLWINGTQVWDHKEARGCKLDNDLIPVFFKKGLNKILLKIEEKGNNWEFCARILPFDIDTFTKRGTLFNVKTSSLGSSELYFSLHESVIDKLFKSAKLEIYTSDKDPVLVWSDQWTKDKIMKLDIEDQSFNSYTLKIIAKRQDGKEWIHELSFQSGLKINYTLFDEQKTNYQIVVGKDASESEQWAASELKKYLKDISGAEFNIVSDDSKSIVNKIIIGFNKHSQKLLGHGFVEPELMDESFVYKNIQSNLVLLGGKQRGTMYAVFSFLENEFGMRWYTPKVTSVPKREQFNFNRINHYEKPTLQVRNDFYYEAFDPIWAVHNKINGAMGFREQHGDIEGYWAVHTFYRFMPPTEFFDSHPEYYSLIDGKRIHERAQLCLTNPDVLEIITDRLKVVMRENPSNLIYSVSQNDWRNPCQCDNCQAIVSKEGAESGIIVWFVNQVAERVKEVFPDKYVGTLAYQYTRKPPKNIKPKENVVIRFCSIECCFAHDFQSCPENQEFLIDLESWSSFTPHLYIWDYVVNFSHYIMPYPNFKVLQPNIKTFIDNNSIGIMEQAAYQSRGGELSELRSYLISKLLWNSEVNVDNVIDDFLVGFYGRSGQYIGKYLDLLHEQIRPDTHIHLGLNANDKLFTNNFIEEATEIFNKAEIIAENDEIKERVELARLPLMYLKCKRDPVNSKYDGTFERFKSIVLREGITHFAEAGEPHIRAFMEQVDQAE